jgi:hypothetical protein
MAQQEKGVLPRPRRIPAGRDLYQAVQGMLARPGVKACFVGGKRTRGKRTRRLALVCGVGEKRPKSDLAPEEILPASVGLATRRSGISRIPTDVITMGRFDVQGTVLGPAEIVNPNLPGFQATTGIALRHPRFGDVVTTAGHAIPPGLPSGAPVVIEASGSGFPARVVSVTTNQFSDHALLQPDDPGLVGNFFRDVTPLGPPYIPDPENDVHTPLFILLANGEVISVQCRGLTASVQTAANIVMHDLILTEQRTIGGNSGTCLVDSNWRVWGLLIGAYHATTDTGEEDSFSVFVPAFRVLSLEGAQFL